MSSGSSNTVRTYVYTIDYPSNPKAQVVKGSGSVNETLQWGFLTRPTKPTLRPLPWTPGTIVRPRYNLSNYVSYSAGGGRITGPAISMYAPNPLEIRRTTNSSDATANYYKARAKMGSGPVNLAENIGEFHQTANMISKRIRQIGEAARQLKNGNLPGLYQALAMEGHPSRRESGRVRDTPPSRRLADHWLEYTYGWSPLVSDVHGALEGMRKGFTDPVGAVKGYSRSSQLPRDSKSTFGNSPKRATGYVAGRVSNPGAHLANGLGLLNPASLAWELMPYSFVVDWFIPVGDVLSSLTAGLGMSGVVGGLVYEDEQIETYGGRPWKSTVTVNRLPINGLPLFLPFNQDVFNQPWQRVVSAISLLRQRFR